MTPTKPSPITWTLRFKQHKSTTLLHIDPLQSFDSIKDELLHALRESHTDGIFNDQQIPKNASEVLLARPNDFFDLEKGWTSLVDSNGNIITAPEPVAKKRRTDEGELKVNDQCPKAAGLKDGFVLAFQFRGKDSSSAALSDIQSWDVVMPSIEEGNES